MAVQSIGNWQDIAYENETLFILCDRIHKIFSTSNITYTRTFFGYKKD